MYRIRCIKLMRISCVKHAELLLGYTTSVCMRLKVEDKEDSTLREDE